MQLLQGVRSHSAMIGILASLVFCIRGKLCVTPHHSTGAVERRLRAFIRVWDALALATHATLLDTLPSFPVTKTRID